MIGWPAKQPARIRELDLEGMFGKAPAKPARRRRREPESERVPFRAAQGPWEKDRGRASSSVLARRWRGTTTQMCGLYPFLSAAPMPPVGVPLGFDVHSGERFSYAPVEWVLRNIVENPNLLLTGRPGSGKSSLAKMVVVRSAAVGVRTAALGDLKGEYNRVAEYLGVAPTILGGGLATRINPLDAGPLGTHLPQNPEERHERIEEVHRRRLALLTALAAMPVKRELTSTEAATLALALRRAEGLERAGSQLRNPLIKEVVTELENMSPGDAGELWFRDKDEFRQELRPITLALHSMLGGVLAGLFDGPTTHPLNYSAPIQTVDISRLDSRGEEAIAMALACLSSWGQAAIDDPTADETSPARQVIRDEMWRQLRYPWLVRKIDSDLRLSRKHGVVQFLITHELGDFDGAALPEIARLIASKCAIRVAYAQDLKADSPVVAALNLNPTECELISSWTAGAIGRGLWRIGPRRGYVVQTRLTPIELHDLTHTNERMRV